MNDVMILRRGGGIPKLFAAIGVTYPVGSILTCTNGTKTLTATPKSEDNTEWVFAIPEPKTLPETWTVTATLGTSSKSQSVSITKEGQFESVALSFALVLFDGVNKVNNTAATGTWRKSGVDTFTVSADSIYFALSDSGESNTEEICYARTGNKIDLTGYTSLSTNISSITKDNTELYLTISADGESMTASISLAKGTRSLDVSKYTGQYYIAFFCKYDLYGTFDPNFTATYLGLT